MTSFLLANFIVICVLKVWFRAKNKADVLDTLTYDPFTGEPVLTGSEKPTNEVEEEGETE